MSATLTPSRTTPADVLPRPLTLLATWAGAAAAGASLLPCLALGVIGWFVSDGGVHGEPRDGLRAGALTWLTAHGSGIHVEGVAVTAVPLGLTLMCAWVVWRFASGLGESVAGHGPDAAALADGERDWTVPVAAGLFTTSYVVVAVLTCVLAATAATQPSSGAVVMWCFGLAGVLGGSAIAVGSGRASVWLALAPLEVRATLQSAGAVIRWFLGASALVFAVALVVDFGAAMNVFSRLHTSASEGVMFVLVIVALVPNAIAFTGAYLLGPGFLVGTGTLVSPTVVAIGPVPMFPLLAALPDNGPTPAWTPALMALPVLCAAVAVARQQRRTPTHAWDRGMLRGVVAGCLAAVAFAVVAAVAGGAVGPGRMADVGPAAGQVLVKGLVSLGFGGLLGGLAMTWWQRRTPLPGPPPRTAKLAPRDGAPEPVDEATEDTVQVPLGGAETRTGWLRRGR